MSKDRCLLFIRNRSKYQYNSKKIKMFVLRIYLYRFLKLFGLMTKEKVDKQPSFWDLRSGTYVLGPTFWDLRSGTYVL